MILPSEYVSNSDTAVILYFYHFG